MKNIIYQSTYLIFTKLFIENTCILSKYILQEIAGAWGQSADPNQWSAYYAAYGQGYDPYAYGTTEDPSAYAYGAYAGYSQYPQQVRNLHLDRAIYFLLKL